MARAAGLWNRDDALTRRVVDLPRLYLCTPQYRALDAARALDRRLERRRRSAGVIGHRCRRGTALQAGRLHRFARAGKKTVLLQRVLREPRDDRERQQDDDEAHPTALLALALIHRASCGFDVGNDRLDRNADRDEG